MLTVPVILEVRIVKFWLVPEPIIRTLLRSIEEAPDAGIVNLDITVPVPTLLPLQALVVAAGSPGFTFAIARVVEEAAVPFRSTVIVQDTVQSIYAPIKRTIAAEAAGCWTVITSAVPLRAVVLVTE